MAADEAAATATPLRVATWNLNHWQQPLLPVDTRRGAWAHLAESIGAQVALVQEAVPPSGLPRDRAVYGEIAGHRNWGSAVVALDPAVGIEPIRSARMPWSSRRYLLDRSSPGSCAVARVSIPGIQPITLVSLYCLLDGPAASSLHRAVADLLPLFESPDGARVVLGGDLNVTTASRDARWLPRSEAALRAVESLGLVEVKAAVADRPAPPAECACGAEGGCGHIGTWKSTELDHLYVSPALASQAVRLSADRGAVEVGLSDHAPLVLDLALTPGRTPHLWDEEAFAAEVGRRHGASAARVVEALVSWADRKERELAAKAGVTAKSLTRFPMNGITAEPELMLDARRPDRAARLGGAALGPRVGRGRALVRRRGSCPRSTSRHGASTVRRLLNEIEGVHLDCARRLPLAADPARAPRGARGAAAARQGPGPARRGEPQRPASRGRAARDRRSRGSDGGLGGGVVGGRDDEREGTAQDRLVPQARGRLAPDRRRGLGRSPPPLPDRCRRSWAVSGACGHRGDPVAPMTAAPGADHADDASSRRPAPRA